MQRFRHFFTTASLLSAAALPLLAAAPSDAALLIEMKMNETGSTATNTATGQFEAGGSGGALTSMPDGSMRGGTLGTVADMHTADGTGVSGLAGDRAFDASGAILNSVPGNNTLGWTGTDFTMSGWLKTNDATSWGGGDDGVSQFLLYALSGGSNQFQLRESATENVPELYIAATNEGTNDTFIADAPIWTDTEEWVFWAVSYEGSAGSDTARAKFYAGSKLGATSLVATADGVALTPYIHDAFIWGNNTNLAQGINGMLDNLRFQDDVASLATLESYRVVDAVPEPASLALLSLGGLALLGRRRSHA